MVEYKIIDNFLSNSDFTELANNILPIPVDSSPNRNHSPRINDFTWQYINSQVPENQAEDHLKKVTNIELLDSLDQWFFGNLCYKPDYQSYGLRYLGSLLNKIKPLAVFGIQVNLTVQQKKRRRSKFHIDSEYLKHTSMITSIFYVNTTNGPTILEDGTEIECRANRLVSYSSNIYHAAGLCTDQPYRVVINLNYFKDMDFS